MLFVPFLELKARQNLRRVENQTIGMGLACSSSISTGLGGDITLKKSEKGLTSFAFKIPVLKIKRAGGDPVPQKELSDFNNTFEHEKLKRYM